MNEEMEWTTEQIDHYYFIILFGYQLALNVSLYCGVWYTGKANE